MLTHFRRQGEDPSLRSGDPGRSRNEFEARIRPVPAADLRARAPVAHHDVGGEVVRATDQRRADAVRVDRDSTLLELADLLAREAARGDDPDRSEEHTSELQSPM